MAFVPHDEDDITVFGQLACEAARLPDSRPHVGPLSVGLHRKQDPD